MEPVLLTIPQFLSKYSISRTAFYREINEKRLSIIKRGKRSLVDATVATKWVEELKAATAKNKI